MSNIEFAWPYAALALLFIIPLWIYQRKLNREQSMLLSPMAMVIMNIVGNEKSAWPRQINWFLLCFWSTLVLSLMRPQYVGDPIEISREGRSIMMVVDLSESMEAHDMSILHEPTDRLTIAKNVMTNFIDKRAQDRIGLVVFGSESFLHAPLSYDHPTIKQFLADTEIGFAGPKTAIGDALGHATKALIEQKQGDRIIILATDGQNNTGTLEPMQAAKIAQKHNVKIYAVGLGASRMVVDGFFGPTAINPSLALDEAEPEMKELTALTGGKYFRAKDLASLESIYKEIDKLEPAKSDPILLIPRKELFFWPLTVVILLMVLKAMLLVLSPIFGRNVGKAVMS